MPTGQSVITNTLTKLGMCDPGGTPSASDSAYALSELKNFWSAVSIDEGLIYAVLSAQYPLTANVQNYTIGSGATFSAPRPARIYKAFVVNSKTFTATTQSSVTVLVADTTGLFVGQGVAGAGIPAFATITAVTTNTSITISIAATASASGITLTAIGLNRNELNIVESGRYYEHNDLGASASTPEELYPNFDDDSNGYARLYIWPVPNGSQPLYLELETAVNFSAWALAVDYNIPAAYQDYIEWTLAFRCISGFGVAISQQIIQIVTTESAKAEARIRQMNIINRRISPEMAAMPGSQQQAAK